LGWDVAYWDRSSPSGQAWIASLQGSNGTKDFPFSFTLQGTANVGPGLQFGDMGGTPSFGITFQMAEMGAPYIEGLREMFDIIEAADNSQDHNLGVVFSLVFTLRINACSEQAADTVLAINKNQYRYWNPAEVTGGYDTLGLPHHVVMVSPTALGIRSGFHDFVIDPYVRVFPVGPIKAMPATEFFRVYWRQDSWLGRSLPIIRNPPLNP
jgi:hypothetical protein